MNGVAIEVDAILIEEMDFIVNRGGDTGSGELGHRFMSPVSIYIHGWFVVGYPV